MSLVYKFIEAMGWRIQVESTPLVGTLVEIIIPIASQEDSLGSEAIQA